MKKTALAVPEPQISKAGVDLDEIFTDTDFADTPAVTVAVSGGSDSLALLLLVHAYLAKMDHPPRLVAVTVDHGLRLDSAREARQVAEFCASRSIIHEIVRWNGEKPKTGLMARARAVRYQLLCDRARLHGARVIFTGHTLDDQAETYLMRAARMRASYLGLIIARGLAAMARQSLLLGEMRLIRPLLEIRRSALRCFLQAQHVQWIDDPSNEDQRFERVRLRQSLDEATISAATVAVAEAAIRRACYNERAIALMQQSRLHCLGEIVQLDLEQFPKIGNRFLDKKGDFIESHSALAQACTEDGLLLQLLADLASIVGGARSLRPPTVALSSLVHHHGTRQRVTLAGAIVEKQGTRLLLWRERRNLHHLNVPAGTAMIWDRRYRIINDSNENIVIRTLDHHALATPIIIGSKGVDIPVLENGFRHNKSLTLERILQPFEFLVVGEDAVFVDYLKQIFAFATWQERGHSLC